MCIFAIMPQGIPNKLNISRMKKILLILEYLFVSAVAIADGETHHCGNNVDNIGDYSSQVLTDMTTYYERVYNHEPYDEERQKLFSTIKRYPEQVNDYVELDGHKVTPLRVAVECNDVELVSLLLEQGAFPVLPNCEELEGLFDGEPISGGEYDIRIVRMIAAKLSELQLYEQAQQKGFKYN